MSQIESFQGPEKQTSNIVQKDPSDSFIMQPSEYGNSSRSLKSYRIEDRSSSLIRRDHVKQNSILIKQISQIHKTLGEPNMLKLMLQKQNLLKFKDNLLSKCYILTNNIKEYKRNIINQFYGADFVQNYQDQELDKDKFTKLGVLRPQDTFIQFWDLAGIIVSLFMLWVGPFISSFELIQSGITKIFAIFIIFFIIIDAFVTCNKAIICQGDIILNRFEILKRYLKNQLFSDILNSSIWILYYNEFEDQIIILAIFQLILLIYQVYSKIQQYTDYLYLNGQLSEVIDLAILILIIYYFAHISCCIFHYIGRTTEYMQHSWLLTYELNNQSAWIKYNYAFYWATMTMTTVGYGDVTAQNYMEIIISNFLMFCSSFIFAYSMNSIGMIVRNLSDTRLKYKRQLILINSYMKTNSVEHDIQMRVRDYLKYYVEQETRENSTDVNLILHNLPSKLKEEMDHNIKIKLINKMKIFTENFSQTFLDLVASNIEVKTYIPNDIIVRQKSTYRDPNIYYILKGQVDVVEERTKKVLYSLKNDEILGEVEFFTGQANNQIIISQGFTQIFTICRSTFLDAIQYCQKDFQRFHHIKDELIQHQNLKSLNRKCQICSSQFHFFNQCNVISYKPDLEKLVKSQNFIYQGRNQGFKRKKYPKINSVGVANQVAESLTQYMQFLPVSFYDLENSVPSQNNFKEQTSKIQDKQTDKVIGETKTKLTNTYIVKSLALDQKNFSRELSVDFKQQTLYNVKLNHSKDEFEKEREREREKEPQIKEREQTREKDFEQFKYQESTFGLQNQKIQFHNCNVDEGTNFNYYMPQHNMDHVIRMANKFKQRQVSQNRSQLYSFYSDIVQKAQNMRKIAKGVICNRMGSAGSNRMSGQSPYSTGKRKLNMKQQPWTMIRLQNDQCSQLNKS